MSSKLKRAPSTLRYSGCSGLGGCEVGRNGWQPPRSVLSVDSGGTHNSSLSR
jgi:hypothetical protein